MDRHPYLRAYMAGITPPVIFLPLLVALVVAIGHATSLLPRQVEWIFLFPLIIIPNAFGLWNMLYVKLHSYWHHPIGLHGAALPFFLGPTVFMVGASLGLVRVTDQALVYFDIIRFPYWYVTIAPFLAVAAYYLIWKYMIGSLNRVLQLPS